MSLGPHVPEITREAEEVWGAGQIRGLHLVCGCRHKVAPHALPSCDAGELWWAFPMTKVHVPSPQLAHDDAYHHFSWRPCTGACSLSETVPHGVVTWMKGQPRPSWQLSSPMQFQTLEGFGTMRLVPNPGTRKDVSEFNPRLAQAQE